MTLHHADDIARGMAPGGPINLAVVLFLAVWLYATVVLVERRWGQIIILVVSLLVSAIPAVHMMGPGMAARTIADRGGVFFFVWTLIALGVSATFSAMLSLGELRNLPRADRAVRAEKSSVD